MYILQHYSQKQLFTVTISLESSIETGELLDRDERICSFFPPHRTSNSRKKQTSRNWVFATNSNCLIPTSLQSGGVTLWYFKLGLFNLAECIAWNILGPVGLQRSRDLKLRVCGKDSNLIFWHFMIWWITEILSLFQEHCLVYEFVMLPPHTTGIRLQTNLPDIIHINLEMCWMGLTIWRLELSELDPMLLGLR